MKIVEIISTSMRLGVAHPTDVLNSLITLENAGGLSAIHELEYRLERLARVTRLRSSLGQSLITDAWLSAARAYLETYTG